MTFQSTTSVEEKLFESPLNGAGFSASPAQGGQARNDSKKIISHLDRSGEVCGTATWHQYVIGSKAKESPGANWEIPSGCPLGMTVNKVLNCHQSHPQEILMLGFQVIRVFFK